MYTGSNPRTGNPCPASRTFRDTRRRGDTAWSNFLTEVVKGQVPVVASATLSEYLSHWLDHITPTRSTTTIRGYRFKIKGISAELGGIRLDRLTAQHLDRVLSAALRQAVKWGLVGEAVTRRATPPPRRSQPHRIPTPEEIQGLISTAEQGGQPVLSAAIAIATPTGLRRRELAGLQWLDLDLEGGRLHVRRCIKSGVDGGWVAWPPKTHQNRVVALDNFTVAVLREHRSRAEGGPSRQQSPSPQLGTC
jgi:integrase